MQRKSVCTNGVSDFCLTERRNNSFTMKDLGGLNSNDDNHVLVDF